MRMGSSLGCWGGRIHDERLVSCFLCPLWGASPLSQRHELLDVDLGIVIECLHALKQHAKLLLPKLVLEKGHGGLKLVFGHLNPT